uniref:Uncharacterized protein n=1 Tax=Parastrongyloides trichosuri TaxID=131310 RepID=A0A0N4ZFM6_PARTI
MFLTKHQPYLKFCKRMINDENALCHINEHYSSSIGGRGTFVIIFHMFNTIYTYGKFNPFKCLDFTRKHYYFAIHTRRQLCSAISSGFNYLRKELMKFETILKNYR